MRALRTSLPLQSKDRRGTSGGCPQRYALSSNEGAAGGAGSASQRMGRCLGIAPQCATTIVGAPLVGARIVVHCPATRATMSMHGRSGIMTSNGEALGQCQGAAGNAGAMWVMRVDTGDAEQCSTMPDIALHRLPLRNNDRRGTSGGCPRKQCGAMQTMRGAVRGNAGNAGSAGQCGQRGAAGNAGQCGVRRGAAGTANVLRISPG